MSASNLVVANPQPTAFATASSSVTIPSDSGETKIKFTVRNALHVSNGVYTGSYILNVTADFTRLGGTSGTGSATCSSSSTSQTSWTGFNNSLTNLREGAGYSLGNLLYTGRNSVYVNIRIKGAWASDTYGDNFDITCVLSLSSDKYTITINHKTRNGSLIAERINTSSKSYSLRDTVALPKYKKLSGSASKTINFKLIDNNQNSMGTIPKTYTGFLTEHETQSDFPWTANGKEEYDYGSYSALELLKQSSGFYRPYEYYPMLVEPYTTTETTPATNLPSEVVKDRTRRGYNLLGYHWNDENGEAAVAGQDVSAYWPNYQNNYTATIMAVYEPKVFKIQFVPNIPRKLSSKHPYKDGIKGKIIVGTKTLNFDTAEVIYDTSYVVPGLKKPDPSGGSDSYVFLANNDVVGYRFLGWSESSSATEATYVPGNKTMYDFDIENTTKKLYGVWQPISNTATYHYYKFNDDGKVSTPTSDTELFDVSMGSTYVKDIPSDANTSDKTSDFVFYGWTRWKPTDYDDETVKGLYTNIPDLEERCTAAGYPIIFPAKTDINSRSESTYNGEAQWGDPALNDEFWGIWTISGKSIKDKYGFQSVAATYVYTPEMDVNDVHVKEGFQYVSHTWVYDGSTWVPDAATKELLSQS